MQEPEAEEAEKEARKQERRAKELLWAAVTRGWQAEEAKWKSWRRAR